LLHRLLPALLGVSDGRTLPDQEHVVHRPSFSTVSTPPGGRDRQLLARFSVVTPPAAGARRQCAGPPASEPSLGPPHAPRALAPPPTLRRPGGRGRRRSEPPSAGRSPR